MFGVWLITCVGGHVLKQFHLAQQNYEVYK